MLSCGRRGISSPQEMLLQTQSWLLPSRDHPSSVPSAQLSQGWISTMSKLEHVPGKGDRTSCIPTSCSLGQGCWGSSAAWLAGWMLQGAGQDFAARLCPAAAGNKQWVTSSG